MQSAYTYYTHAHTHTLIELPVPCMQNAVCPREGCAKEGVTTTFTETVGIFATNTQGRDVLLREATVDDAMFRQMFPHVRNPTALASSNPRAYFNQTRRRCAVDTFTVSEQGALIAFVPADMEHDD